MTRLTRKREFSDTWQLTNRSTFVLGRALCRVSAMGVCTVCKAPSDKKCSLCSNVFYCSREHQKEDWKKHKLKCIPYKVEANADLGRHLVATRRIGTGEEVLRESPLVSGPLQITPPVCLGCYSLLTELNSVECPKCGWPMCSTDCWRAEQHIPECRVTVENRGAKVKIQTFSIAHPSYESLTTLRCLYLKKDQPKIWEKLNRLQSHCEERKFTDNYKQDQRSIAQFIHRFYKYQDFSEEDILRVLGIINTNAHEVPIRKQDFISIYDTASYLEHNCQANCSKGFSPSGELVVRAARTIEPGEHLSICYTDPLWGTASRRQHLQETKFFKCSCARCSDPTELGTHFSSLKCRSAGCKGFLVPISPLESEKTNWQCLSCHSLRSPLNIDCAISQASHALTLLDKNVIADCKKFISQQEPILNPHHYLIVDVKLAITQILDSDVSNLSDEDLALKLRYCRQLEQLITKLVPAENRCRGVLLFGLHAAMAEIARRMSNRGEIDTIDLKNNLLECRHVLMEAYQLLRHEPDILPEGQIALQAKTNLKDMDRILQTIHASIGDSPA